MTTETKTSDQQSPYYRLEQDGSVLPLDPITGNALRPGVIPESLLADEELRNGYNFLVNNASRVSFTLLLSSHGTAEHLREAGIDLHAEAKALAASNGVLFLECISPTDKGHDSFARKLNYLSHLSPEKKEDTAWGLLDILDDVDLESAWPAKITQLANTGVRVALPDFNGSSPRPADRALTQWSNAKRALDWSDNKQAIEWQALDVGNIAYRDWYLVCKMGSTLAELDAQGQLDESIDASLLVGPLHGTIGAHMNNMGIQVTYKGKHGEKLEKQSSHSAQDLHNVGATALTLANRIDFLANLLEDEETI